jgi:outer membrane protein
MLVAIFMKSARQALSLGLVALLTTASFAQDATQSTKAVTAPPLTPMPQAPAPQNNAHIYSEQNYSKSVSGFPNFFAPYRARAVPPPNLNNSAMTDKLFHDGTIYLSINDAVAMAIENNLDVTLQRYNLSIADTDILLTSSGQPSRGVNAGVVQGTPGGAIGAPSAGGTGSTATGATGTGAGGTQIGAGGAGAGALGIVSSTLGGGPPIDNFDPVITGTLQGEHAITPQPNTVFTGTTSLNQNTNTYNFGYTQGFSTGTLLSVTFDNSYVTTNSLFALVTPQLTPAFRFQLRQHLLQGFGFDPNLRYIRIARNNREITDVVFRQQIITTVSQIENIYWDLVTAYEAVQVNQRALELANKVLSDDQEQVKIGTMAPITLAQAESGVASAKQNLILSQTNLQLEQLLMKNAITKNMQDPLLAEAPVIPTDTLNPNERYEVRPIGDLIAEALQARPEIASARINLTNLEISRKSIRNELLPSLDAYAFYGASGLAGPQNPAVPICDPAIQQFTCYQPGIIPTTYNAAFGNMFNSSAPDKGIGVNLNIPIRNRAAQANQVRSDLEYRQAQVALQQTENTITLQVRQAQFAMQQNYAALQAAIAARDYARESLTAEQKKFTYGASTPTLVLQASSNLTQAESNVLNAAANYEKSKVNLDYTTAETLTKLGVDVADAEAGKVKRMPNIHGVVPAHGASTPGAPEGEPQPENPLGPAPEQPSGAPAQSPPVTPAPAPQTAPPPQHG